jgi:serine/threonine protein kinase
MTKREENHGSLMNPILNNHPNLTEYKAAISDKKKTWIVMEYCNGMNMEDLIFKNQESGKMVSEYKAITCLN